MRHHVNVTPFEPERRLVTLRSRTRRPARAIYANEGPCQILFFQSDEMCGVSYADRKGSTRSSRESFWPKL
jgi:dCTP deaminase